MLFNSYIFILLFLPLTLAGYFILNHLKQYRSSMGYLVLMSLWFYGYFNVKYLLVIGISIVINYILSRLLERVENEKVKKCIFLMGILANLGSIFYFKYCDFFISNINIIFHTDFNLLHILLPLGISFFTFQQISFIVDCYKGEMEKCSFIEYAAYVSFFPQLVAGPIVLHDELIPQFRDLSKKTINYENFSHGLYCFSMGLGKKVLLADTFSLFVNVGYADIGLLDSTNALIVMLFYTLQIYFDFSGYCDMAIGIGKMFNIDLPINFNSPYKAKSIEDFWDRWHMTLTRFFTRYIYIPLGGSKKGKTRTYINILIIFLVSGLWHGANWTFVFWGFLHGIALVIYKVFKRLFNKIPALLMQFITFLFINITWIYFRAESISMGTGFIKILCSFQFGQISQDMIRILENMDEFDIMMRILPDVFINGIPGLFIYILAMIGCIGVFVMHNTVEKDKLGVISNTRMLTTVVILVWSILSFSGVSEFLYFNF